MGQRHNAMVVGRLWRGVLVGKISRIMLRMPFWRSLPSSLLSASNEKCFLVETMGVWYLSRLCLQSDVNKHADKIAPVPYPSSTVLCVALSTFKFTESAHFLNATRVYSSFFVCAEKPLSLLHFQGR